jgi:hypothetical protein
MPEAKAETIFKMPAVTLRLHAWAIQAQGDPAKAPAFAATPNDLLMLENYLARLEHLARACNGLTEEKYQALKPGDLTRALDSSTISPDAVNSIKIVRKK